MLDFIETGVAELLLDIAIGETSKEHQAGSSERPIKAILLDKCTKSIYKLGEDLANSVGSDEPGQLNLDYERD